ncbi:MAG: Rpn family recombination-promoting nuclease/putative transposase, partial [Treponema sp.]|nr:Rpn family recombination-promoting nuclease/putative transposase [Treponema sp.]
MTEEKIIPWEKLPITNTFMFNKVMTSDLDACRGVIETLLGIKISRVECVQDEKTLEVDALAKGVRFDVYVSNSTQVFDVELQMTNRGDLPMRARYYQSVADVDALNRGMGYSALKENYTLFLCPFDLFGRKLPVYTFENVCKEAPEIKLNDKTLKVFYNFKRYDMIPDEERKRLLEFFSSGRSASRLTGRLDTILHELQGKQRWRQQYMTLEMMLKERHDDGIAIGEKRGEKRGRAEGIAEGRTEGIAIGIQQTQIETARNMLKNGLSADLITKCTGISAQQISELL